MAIVLEGAQVGTVTTAAGQVVSVTYHVAVKDGQLSVTLNDQGGTDANAVINGLEVVWVGPAGPRVLAASPNGTVMAPIDRIVVTFDEAVLDGSFTLADVVSLAGPAGPIAPTAVNRLSATTYEVVFAPQSATGDYSLTVGPDIADLSGNLMDQDADGVPGESLQDRFTHTLRVVPFVGRYDFGVAGSPVADGYTAVLNTTTYSASAGFGWLGGPVQGVDRGTGNPLTRDLNYERTLTFAVDLPSATYDVTLTIGDTGPYQHDQMGVFLEGTQVDTVNTVGGEVRIVTYRGVRVNDGQLSLTLQDLGGFDANVVINGLEVVWTGSSTSGQSAALVGDASARSTVPGVRGLSPRPHQVVSSGGASRSLAAPATSLPAWVELIDSAFATSERGDALLLPWELSPAAHDGWNWDDGSEVVTATLLDDDRWTEPMPRQNLARQTISVR
jgi:hypothetical protein